MTMRSRSRLLCSLLTLALACTYAPAARASDDGKLCQGLGMLICVPVFVGANVVHMFEPKSRYARLDGALAQEDVAGAKRLVLEAAPDERIGLFSQIVSHYLAWRDDANPARLALIGAVLDERQVDVSSDFGTKMLQEVVSASPTSVQAAEGASGRRLALAKVLIAHGARADAVLLGDCSECTTDPAFIRLMMGAGADIDRAGGLYGSLFERMAEYGSLDTAERLLTLGADPNGRPAGGKGMLQRMAARCDLRPAQSGRSAAAEAYLKGCVEGSIARSRFAITHGADPNGQTTWENGKCETPYAIAVNMQNTALAEALRDLGADPVFNARCLWTAPRQP
jgi:hypothetical protein